jgi:hypothetical protein
LSDILCLEVDLVEKTGRSPLTDTGPLSLLSRTGRWCLLKEEGLGLLKMTPEQKSAVLQTRKAILMPDAFTDFFGPPMEFDDDQDQ